MNGLYVITASAFAEGVVAQVRLALHIQTGRQLMMSYYHVVLTDVHQLFLNMYISHIDSNVNSITTLHANA